MASFGIRTPADLLNKLIEEQRDFEKRSQMDKPPALRKCSSNCQDYKGRPRGGSSAGTLAPLGVDWGPDEN